MGRRASRSTAAGSRSPHGSSTSTRCRPTPTPKSPLVERAGDTGFIQLQAPSFATLTENQKQLAYWLTQASIAIDPIIYDQLSRYGLREKRLLEGVMAHHQGVAPATFGK